MEPPPPPPGGHFHQRPRQDPLPGGGRHQQRSGPGVESVPPDADGGLPRPAGQLVGGPGAAGAGQLVPRHLLLTVQVAAAGLYLHHKHLVCSRRGGGGSVYFIEKSQRGVVLVVLLQGILAVETSDIPLLH
jgi:hypothetical protein